jgi:hypothetical protein
MIKENELQAINAECFIVEAPLEETRELLLKVRAVNYVSLAAILYILADDGQEDYRLIAFNSFAAEIVKHVKIDDDIIITGRVCIDNRYFWEPVVITHLTGIEYDLMLENFNK